MKYWIISLASILFLTQPAAGAIAREISLNGKEPLEMKVTARYESGAAFNEGGTEIVAYDKKTKQLFSINGAEKALDIISLALDPEGDFSALKRVKQIPLGELSPSIKAISDITSVAVSPDGSFLAVAVTAEPETDPGYVIFLKTDGTYIHHVRAGALPDMVTFTPDGKKVLSANEGEPSGDYKVNPEGSVSIIDLSNGVNKAKAKNVLFDENVKVDRGIRKVNPDSTQPQNFEPEYLAVKSDSSKAYAVLQESNAIAELDLKKGAFTRVYNLGYKDHSLSENAMDASGTDGKIDIKPYPVLGLYQPDGIAIFKMNGKEYLITPNEGDSQDYEGYSEEIITAEAKDKFDLKARHFKGLSQKQIDRMVEAGLFDESQLGKLVMTKSAPVNKEGKYEAIYSLGGRSFSIRDTEDMKLVWDSGAELEKITAKALPKYFNTPNDENLLDDRSVKKGPEPETAAAGIVDGQYYAFIGLEGTGGVAAYQINDPEKPRFSAYYSTREFKGDEPSGDVAPEGVLFINAEDSPNGRPLLAVAHEVSGTIAVMELGGGSSGKEHVVKKGETLTDIAGMYGTAPEYLRALNGLNKPDLLFVSQRLKTGPVNTQYKVEKGDTLYEIAANAGVPWPRLMKINYIEDPDFIMAGQTLMVPEQ
ncbi:choice-of-anchor I family protein [Metabacillus sp. 113a]|uniref:choice-of-anchor I family protein n=1 Tax=Metabacillus sp. 113a TaxID=3404706 RepID=UPI003CF17185